MHNSSNSFIPMLFSSPVRKYRRSYLSHHGIGVGVSVGAAQMLKFWIKVFISLYLLNMLIDYVDILHVGRYWSDVLFCTIMTYLGDLGVKVTDLEILCLIKVFVSLCLLNMLMDQTDTLYVNRYWSEFCCSSMTHLSDIEFKVTEFQIYVKALLKLFRTVYFLNR